MRQLDLNGASILIARDDDAARAALATMKLPEGRVVGSAPGTLTVGDGEREIESVEAALGPAALSRLEQQAYGLADVLLEAQADGLLKSILTSAYHEIATGVLRVAAMHEVLAQGDIMLALLDAPLAAAFGVGQESAAPSGRLPLTRLRAVLRPLRRSLRLLRQLPAALRAGTRLAGRRIAVVTCNDSGTGINLRPLKAILPELDTLQIPVLLLTEVALVAEDPDLSGRNTLVIDGDLPVFPVRMPPPEWQEITAARSLPPTLVAALDRLLAWSWPKYVTRLKRVQRVLGIANRLCAVRAVLSVPDTLPVSIAAGLWARDRSLSWLGHFGATIGRCPDHYFFPATEHLAYGLQLADHIASTGNSRSAIHVVGSPAFDAHLGRDRIADRATVETDFPRVHGNRLIVVTSEAFPDPATELVPILQAVTRIAGAHVVFKLHPDDNPAAMREMAERAGVADSIDIVHRYPLGQLLGAADLLVSVMSTVIIEAAVVGTPTLVCDFSGKSAVLDFVEEGLSLGCYDPRDVQRQAEAMLFDAAVAESASQKMRDGIERFNGPNDGQSAKRIARLVSDRVNSGVAANGHHR
ncbi:UDP-N-acetylglucosamine 2-epimerase [Hoeflea sp. AS16]|uniref:UDP-N-acetylglucosamine 2-epimerase n=1 Tax=Hoeflea sp. AS16 TaxID=3135779 RepID=UPI00317E35E8